MFLWLSLLNVHSASASQKKTRNTTFESGLLCVDKRDAIKAVLEILEQPAICGEHLSYITSEQSTLTSIDHIIEMIPESFSYRQEVAKVQASEYLKNASFVQAFLPTFSLTSGSYGYSKSFEDSSSQTKQIESLDPSSTSSQYNDETVESTNTNLTFMASIPILQLAEIKTYNYQLSSDKATLFSSTNNIKSLYATILNESIDLWVSYNRYIAYQDTVNSSIQSLESSLALYQIGQQAIPDLSEALSVLRASQSKLSSYYLALQTSHNNLAASLDLVADDLIFNTHYFEPSTLTPLDSYKPVLSVQTLNDSLKYNDSLSADLFNSSASLDLSKSYLYSYLPQVNLNIGYNYSITDDNQKSSNCKSYSSGCSTTSNIDSYTSRNTPSIALGFTWTFFDSSSNYFTSKSYAKEAESTFLDAQNNAVESINSTKTLFFEQFQYQDILNLNISALEYAQTAYDLTYESFQGGFTPVSTLMQRLNNLSSAKINFYDSIQSLLETKVGLMKSLSQSYVKLNPFSLDYSINVSEKLNVIINAI